MTPKFFPFTPMLGIPDLFSATKCVKGVKVRAFWFSRGFFTSSGCHLLHLDRDHNPYEFFSSVEGFSFFFF